MFNPSRTLHGFPGAGPSAQPLPAWVCLLAISSASATGYWLIFRAAVWAVHLF